MVRLLPDPGFEIVKGGTALLVIDPQNDFLSEKGVAWGAVGKTSRLITGDRREYRGALQSGKGF